MTQTLQIDTRELAWAAGLFEGEGSIHLTKQKKARISLTMSDEDSVRRFHAALGGLGAVSKPFYPRLGTKPVWEWRAARFEPVQAVVAMLWYGLGERRRAKCAEVLGGVQYCDRTSKCKNGHPRTEAGTILRPDGRRECRECNQTNSRNRYRRINDLPEERFRK